MGDATRGRIDPATPSRSLGVVDWLIAPALALAGLAVVGLPAVTAELLVPATDAGVAIAAGILGAIALVGCWITASLRPARPVAGLPWLLAGVALWAVMVLVGMPLLGWRPAAGVIGLASAGVLAVGWFTFRGYPARAYPWLALLLIGSVAVFLAHTPLLLVVGLVLGPLLAIGGANLARLATSAR